MSGIEALVHNALGPLEIVVHGIGNRCNGMALSQNMMGQKFIFVELSQGKTQRGKELSLIQLGGSDYISGITGLSEEIKYLLRRENSGMKGGCCYRGPAVLVG